MVLLPLAIPNVLTTTIFLGLQAAPSAAATNLDDAVAAANQIGYPVLPKAKRLWH